MISSLEWASSSYPTGLLDMNQRPGIKIGSTFHHYGVRTTAAETTREVDVCQGGTARFRAIFGLIVPLLLCRVQIMPFGPRLLPVVAASFHLTLTVLTLTTPATAFLTPSIPARMQQLHPSATSAVTQAAPMLETPVVSYEE